MSSQSPDPGPQESPLPDPASSQNAEQATSSSQTPPNALAPALPGRSQSSFAIASGMSASSTPLGNVNAARKLPQSTMARGAVNPDIAARMRAFHLERRGAPPAARDPGSPQPPSNPSAPVTASTSSRPSPQSIPTAPVTMHGIPSNVALPAGLARPVPQPTQSAPSMPSARGLPTRGPSLAEKRGLRLPGGLPGQSPVANAQSQTGTRKKPVMSLANVHGTPAPGDTGAAASEPVKQLSAMDRYSEYIDKETGSLKFKGKAVLTNKGVEFASGQSFSISLDEVDTLDELGKGNYGTVYKVRHARPTMRRPGQGLAGNKVRQEASPVIGDIASNSPAGAAHDKMASAVKGQGTGKVMAMKELRLELEDAKFAAIIMELDVLHKCVSPYIVDFYGAFFQEGAVYICMEFMDGSIDKLYGDGISENVLQKITLATTRGLRVLKDEHNIIHRDVKPTNILVNAMGAVKICDFGVSGNLVASIARTNIGCQSYMAPERISSGGVAQAGANPGGGTYSVQSDIWSLGLTIIECALGRYPYPPETYDNIFSQLSAIVDGSPPDLPADTFSEAARDFVAGCLNKVPKLRPTYAMLLQHSWLATLNKVETISEEDEEAAENGEEQQASTNDEYDEHGERWIDRDVGLWVREQLQKKREGRLNKHKSPALHAAPLDAASTPDDGSAVRKSRNAGAVAV